MSIFFNVKILIYLILLCIVCFYTHAFENESEHRNGVNLLHQNKNRFNQASNIFSKQVHNNTSTFKRSFSTPYFSQNANISIEKNHEEFLQNILRSDDVLPHLNKVLPHSNEVHPHSKELLPHSKEVLQHSKEVLPHSKEVLPHSKEVLPHSKEVLPHSREVLPHSNEVPNSQEVISPSREMLDKNNVNVGSNSLNAERKSLNDQLNSIKHRTEEELKRIKERTRKKKERDRREREAKRQAIERLRAVYERMKNNRHISRKEKQKVMKKYTEVLKWLRHNSDRCNLGHTGSSSDKTPSELLEEWKNKHGNCGRNSYLPSRYNNRIVGGIVSQTGNWPWMVSLAHECLGDEHWCGGSLISPSWVVTSPHCIFSLPMLTDISKWKVRLGINNVDPSIATSDKFQQTRLVAQLIIHPDFNMSNVLNPPVLGTPNDNDIALIHLNRPIRMTKYVKPICLPDIEERPEVDQTCVVTGWGLLASPEANKPLQFANLLHEAVVPIIKKSDCTQLDKYDVVSDNMICAGYRGGGVDTCKGDSGGPLQCNKNNRWQLTGITSWGDAGGDGCGKPNRPGVYAAVGKFVKWILEQVNSKSVQSNYVEITKKYGLDYTAETVDC